MPGLQPGAVCSHSVKGVLLDLGGVVYVGSTAIKGAPEAIQRLRDSRLPIRFITNTTRRSRRQVICDLRRMGLEVPDNELLTPAQMAQSFMAAQNLSPFLVVHPNLRGEFSELSAGAREAVVVGDAGDSFTYGLINTAYRKLATGAEFLALAKNRNFRDADGELSLDAGPFVVALEYASGRKATLLGKPSVEFFKLAVDSLGCNPCDVVMIGDDAEADVGGAMAAGLKGLLVRTGKYRAGQENELTQPPDWVVDSIDDAVRLIVS